MVVMRYSYEKLPTRERKAEDEPAKRRTGIWYLVVTKRVYKGRWNPVPSSVHISTSRLDNLDSSWVFQAGGSRDEGMVVEE